MGGVETSRGFGDHDVNPKGFSLPAAGRQDRPGDSGVGFPRTAGSKEGRRGWKEREKERWKRWGLGASRGFVQSE